MAVLLMLAVVVSSGVVFAAPSASMLYTETNVGGGWWQYDYMFANSSTAEEYLYSVFFDFAQESDAVGLALPSGWDGTVWMGANTTTYLDTFATSGNDLAAGNNLSGFSFKVNYQAGSTPYTAYFDDHSGGFSSTSGTTALVPEPVSTILFLSGGSVLALRRYIGKKRRNS
jgi:hypothetical protein